ncbi:MAG: hypothetical protein CMO44_16500 [Verrucomicrobiales bacterium]|nr:hypothetical protein [Verrucomicrobiales bacterium]
MGVQTVVVHPALNLDASHVRITFVAVLTGTHWLVLDDSTEGVLSTGTRIFANPVDAGVSLSTLVISTAARQDGWQRSAAILICADVAVGAGTNHRPHWEGVDHCAYCWVVTGVEVQTEVFALLAETSVPRWAVLVLDTLWSRQWNTVDVCVASESNGTSALGLVVSHQTFSILGAWVLVETGVDTVLASAGLVLRTLLVTAAANHLTSNEGVSLIAWYALTHGSVPGWVALSISSTRILDETRVDTVSIHAGLLVTALVVALAANRFTGNLRIANETGRTHTDGAVVLYEAGGTGPTVAWVDTLSVDACSSVGAVIIPCTARRVGQINWLTFCLGIWHPAFPAGADHSSEGQAVHNSANGSDIAGRERKARVFTTLIQASCVVRAVAIHVALGLRWCTNWLLFGRAGDQRVAHPPRWALAFSDVVLNRACGVL